MPPVAARRILACRDILVAGLGTRFGGVAREPTHGLGTMPDGVTVESYVSSPAFVVPIRAPSLQAVHDQAVRLAWSEGAWDLALTFHPPLSGPELGMVSAGSDYSADEEMRTILLEAAARGRLATWLWLPLLGAPARHRAHAAKDASLDPDGGRSEPVPALRAPDLDWRKSRAWTIRLGRWSDAHRPKPFSPRATSRQLACIRALRRAAGLRLEPLAGLSLRQASAMIDALRASGAP